jgi:hypothetical protein
MRPIPHRAFHAPQRSEKASSGDIRATLPDSVTSHPRKPGTDSSATPPPAEVSGPQQGGFSMPCAGESQQLDDSTFFFSPLMFPVSISQDSISGPSVYAPGQQLSCKSINQLIAIGNLIDSFCPTPEITRRHTLEA